MNAIALPAKQPDKRMQRTKEAIRSALLGLLSQKDASHIKVSELTEAADISRKTFYLHYSSVDDALTELENEIVQKVTAALRESNLWENRRSLYTALCYVDKALRQDPDYSCYLKSRCSRYFMLYRLKEAIKPIVMEKAQDVLAPDTQNLDAVTDFAVSGVVSMYSDWLKKQEVTLQQLAEKADQILHCGMMSLLGKKTVEKEK